MTALMTSAILIQPLNIGLKPVGKNKAGTRKTIPPVIQIVLAAVQ